MSESPSTASPSPETHHVTPYYKISYQVCNAPQSKVLTLDATGTNLTFTLYDSEASRLVADGFIDINEKNQLFLKDTVEISEGTVIIYVKRMITPDEEIADTYLGLSHLLPTSSQLAPHTLPEYPSRHDNQMHLILYFSKSFCTDKTTTLSTIIIVTLSVICLLLLTSLTLAIVILRRKKPYLFSAKGSPHESSSSNQVAPW